MPQPVCDLTFGLFSIRQGNPYDEIVNMANYISCALSDGWYFFFEAERLRRELAALKGRRSRQWNVRRYDNDSRKSIYPPPLPGGISDSSNRRVRSAVGEMLRGATARNNGNRGKTTTQAIIQACKRVESENKHINSY